MKNSEPDEIEDETQSEQEVIAEAEVLRIGQIAEMATAEVSVQNEYREAAIVAKDFFRLCAMEILSNGPQTFAFECWIMAMGWTDLLPEIKTATDLSKKWKCTDAAVGKIVKRMQSRLSLPPMPGQRSAEACEKFTTIRKSQLTQKPWKKPLIKY